ncbi:MAG: CBS and ACT domain-containing protein [Erysipelotrichaceae bacterium]|nr:CBS and ACT domain-containing protein [Erysipelotrichaceae bacterium]
MYVKDNMTVSPVTIGPNLSVSDAMEVMSANNLHRLPVVDAQNRLVGLLTTAIIRLNSPNNSTTLSVFELNYLLNKLTVKDIMVTKVMTIGEDDLLEEAATKMLKNDIGCLPVVDKDNVVRGIITHNDIFAALINLLGYNHKGIRYVVNVSEDKPGIMEDISRIFKEHDVNMSNIAVYYTVRGVEVVVLTYGETDLSDVLKAAGYNVTDVKTMH